jgi:hypothetical protein
MHSDRVKVVQMYLVEAVVYMVVIRVLLNKIKMRGKEERIWQKK